MSTFAYNPTSLKALFNNEGSNAAYLVNPLMIQLNNLKDGNFQSVINPDKYLKTLTLSPSFSNIPLYFQDNSNINAKILSDSVSVPDTSLGSNSPYVSTIDTTISPQNMYDGVKITTILNNLVTNVNPSIYNFAVTSPSAVNIASYHSNFNDFLTLIMISICDPFYNSALPLLSVPQVANTPLVDAVMNVRSLYTSKIKTLRTYMDNLLKTSFNKALLKPTSATTDDNGNFIDLTTGSFGHSFFYYLRQTMTASMSLPTSVFPSGLDANTSLFIKQLCSDLHIKTNCPLIQFMYLDGLKNIYVSKGDFINMRWCILAQVNYVYQWIKFIYSSIINNVVNNTLTANDIANYSVLAQALASTPYDNTISKIIQQLKNYMDVLNTNFKTGTSFMNTTYTASTQSLVNQLRNLTASSESDSKTLATKQKDISTTQMALRSYSDAIGNIKDSYKGQVLEFNILLAIVIVIICVTGVFIVLKKPHFVIIGSIIVVIAVLVFKLITTIFNFFVKKNK